MQLCATKSQVVVMYRHQVGKFSSGDCLVGSGNVPTLGWQIQQWRLLGCGHKDNECTVLLTDVVNLVVVILDYPAT